MVALSQPVISWKDGFADCSFFGSGTFCIRPQFIYFRQQQNLPWVSREQKAKWVCLLWELVELLCLVLLAAEAARQAG